MRPNCPACPLAPGCVANADGLQGDIPAPRRKRARPRRETTLLVIEANDGRLLLEKRPPAGIWGGLWSLPEIAPEADIAAVCRERFGIDVTLGAALPPIEHGFTHFLLTLHARRVQYRQTVRIMDGDFAWYGRDDRPGLPAPIARLVDSPQLKLGL